MLGLILQKILQRGLERISRCKTSASESEEEEADEADVDSAGVY